jgi:hypothetical protein
LMLFKNIDDRDGASLHNDAPHALC